MKRPKWRGFHWFTKQPIEDLECSMAREAARIAKAAFDTAEWTYYPYDEIPSVERLTELLQEMLLATRDGSMDKDSFALCRGRFVIWIQREHGLPVRRRVMLDLGVMETLDDFFYED